MVLMGALTGRSAFSLAFSLLFLLPYAPSLSHRMIVKSLDLERTHHPYRDVGVSARKWLETITRSGRSGLPRSKAYQPNAGVWASKTRSAGAIHLPMPSRCKAFG